MSKKAGRAAEQFAQAVGLQQRGATAEAERLYRRILDADRSHAGALQYLAIIEAQRGRVDEAIRLLTRCVRAHPGSAEPHTNLGYALVLAGRHAEALAAYDAALAADPSYVVAWNHRGHGLATLGRRDEALASYDRAVALAPDFADAHYNRGNLLAELGRFEEAIASFDRSLASAPGRPLPAINRANALRALGRPAEAVETLSRVVAADPRNVLALVNRGHMLSDLKRYPEAITSYRAALAIDPAHPHVLSPMAWAAMAICDFPLAETTGAEMRRQVGTGRSVIQPFTFMSSCDDPALQRACAEKFVAGLLPAPPPPLTRPAAPPAADGKIRLAYLSTDFRRHPMVPLIGGVLEAHDRSRFEVLAVSIGIDDGSPDRRRIVEAADAFHDARDKTDREIAELLAAHGVDILIDLNGHTQGGRPAIAAHRPAPVQVSYIGYPGTGGAEFIDYLIADGIVVPDGNERFFSEKVVRLPGCYLAYGPGQDIPAETPTRGEVGLPEQGFVFCSFNNTYKITAPVLDVWMRLLAAVPGSVLWLLGDTPAAETNLRREAAVRGVDPARLVFAERVSPGQHLARHRLADLFLDTLPYNAHTTACDAMWMGVPLVTCPGHAFAGRVAASLLTAVGLPDLIAPTHADYEALALRLATDPARLQACRDRLADRTALSIFDVDGLRRRIEAAYLRMWEIRHSGEHPQSFTVAPM
ncbi:MAG: tetratricopeptide repeat protein [Rhodoplanes sp.]|uniref:O-linked N-acetylglucosamine transferase, SPINDLY family protein n=1 Tax=Rhodoplanes sp. TaxID=1968906 RepID=UPI0017A30B18|nr:glycosyltransferase family 41 protein [Rhodoplanes sp.]NVO13971.1 tetratricopeptide repeat protein [Rhodoplanes sp.]